MHPRSPEAHSVFGTGALLLCQPSEMVRVAGVAPWWACASTLLVPNKAVCCWHYTLKIGCQGWTRTNTVRFNKPSCYFDTTWHRLIGAAGRIPTCIIPLRRRMPDVFDHGSKLKLVSAGRFALPIARSQAECVGCYATRCSTRHL